MQKIKSTESEYKNAIRNHENDSNYNLYIIHAIKQNDMDDMNAALGYINKTIRNLMIQSIIADQINIMRNYDKTTFEHSINVAMITSILAIDLRYTKSKINDIVIAAIFHDIGKCQIPLEILNKPSQLTQEEKTIIKKHNLYSAKIASKIGFSDKIITAIYEHHDDWINHKAEHIQLSDIIHVADVYDALLAKRSYKDAFSITDAYQFMDTMKGNMFHPIVIDVLKKHINDIRHQNI